MNIPGMTKADTMEAPLRLSRTLLRHAAPEKARQLLGRIVRDRCALDPRTAVMILLALLGEPVPRRPRMLHPW